MKIKTYLRRLTDMLLAALLLILPVSAAGHVDTEAECSVEISFVPQEAAANVHFSLYKIADISQTSAPVKRDLYSDFTGLTSLLASEHPDDYRLLCTGLSGYIASHSISCDYETVTDGSGRARFSALETGFYYVSGETYTNGDKSYIPESFVLQLPSRSERDRWDYAPRVAMKWSEKSDLVSLELIKTWSDSATNQHEKDSVCIMVYVDAELFGSYTLNAENNWRMTLKDMDGHRQYSFVESPVPEGYTASIRQNGNRVIIQNNKKDKDSPDPIPDTGQKKWPAVLCVILAFAVLVINRIFGKDSLRNDWVSMALSFTIILCGLFFAVRNDREEQAADLCSRSIISEMKVIEEAKEKDRIITVPTAAPTMAYPEVTARPLFLDAPMIEMPCETIETENVSVIGMLDIPAIGKSFPIGSDCTYENLKKCPCRYYGSVYQGNLVIAGHSYSTVFGPLWALDEGCECSFTDMDGNTFRYILSGKEDVDAEDPEAMISGDWDLTLFTCARGGGKKPRMAMRFALEK